MPEQGTEVQKGSREYKVTYQRQEDNPAHEEPSSSLSSMATATRQTTESQSLNVTVLHTEVY